MLRNAIVRAIRNLNRNAAFTLINTVGLSLGMTAFILIGQYVAFEKSYNTLHTHLPQLYRTLIEKTDGQIEAFTAPGVAPIAAGEIPAMDQFCRVAEGANLGTGIVSLETAKGSARPAFRENHFVYADGTFFDMFSFHQIAGKPDALSQPNVVALSRSTSMKYFGDETPLGKVITLNNQFGKTAYMVQSVYEDMPGNSDLQYDLVFSLQTLSNPANLNGNDMWARLDGTGSQWLFTYLMLKPGAAPEAVADQYTQIMHRTNPEDAATIRLQKVSAMHLGESLADTLPTFGSLRFIYLLMGIATLILIIAWFNYINLSTAGAMKRARGVGIQKVVGASRAQLVGQFLGESAVLYTLAFGLSLAWVGILQMPYAQLTGKNLTIDIFTHAGFWNNTAVILLLGSLASGLYIALVLSSFNPSKVLKGVFSNSTKGVLVRKSLVVIQFSISLMLIAATIILIQQWKYMENKDLGMDASQLVIVRGAEVSKDETFRERSNAFENDLRGAAFVDRFSRSGNVPTEGFNFSTAGITRLNPRYGEEKVNYDMLTIDDRYLGTYHIKMAAGNNFTTAMCARPWNEMEYLILNERAADLMGFASPQDAVGQKVNWNGRVLEVRGVTKNYHHLSVQNAIGPVVFLPSSQGDYYTIRLATRQLTAHLAALEKSYIHNFPGNPFEYQFLDDTFAAKYRAERQYSIVFTVASALAILIGCLGLFGLATYSIDQRTKEIGVRKVLGSSAAQIVHLLSKDFIKLIVIAFLIAAPLAWWLMEQWLQQFAYRIDISWWVFAVAGLATAVVAWLSVSVRAFQGATQNPVHALRSE